MHNRTIVPLLAFCALACETSSAIDLVYERSSAFNIFGARHHRLKENGLDVTQAVQDTMLGEAQTLSTRDALSFLDNNREIADLANKREWSAAMEIMGKGPEFGASQGVEHMINTVDRINGLFGKAGSLATDLIDITVVARGKDIVTALKVFDKQTMDDMLKAVFEMPAAVDAEGNLNVGMLGRGDWNGWPLAGVGNFARPTSPPPEGFWGAALALKALVDTYNELKRTLPDQIEAARLRDQQLAAEAEADKKRQEEAEALKYLAPLWASAPKSGLNQTTANSAQDYRRARVQALNAAKTYHANPTEENRAAYLAALRARRDARAAVNTASQPAASGGTFVRMHSHPYYSVSPPPSSTHPDDNLGSATPVPIPAGHVAVPSGASTYMQWGSWQDAAGGPGKTDLATTGPAYWIAGQITPTNGVPPSGTATYNGVLEGTAHTRDNNITNQRNPTPVTGNFTLTANFGTRGLNGQFNFVSGFAPGASFNATATWDPATLRHTGTLSGSGQGTGQFDGFFFGPNAEEIGGVWNATSTLGVPAGSHIKAQGVYHGARGTITP